MSKSQRLNSIFKRAKEKEKRFDWLMAVELYTQALGEVEKKGFLERGEVQEKIGNCFYRAAFQAETQSEFKKLMRLSVGACEKAAEHSEKSGDSKRRARTNSCRGMASYRKSWLAENSSERKMLLDECCRLRKEALKVYEETEDQLGYGMMCNDLLLCLLERLYIASDWKEMRDIAQEGTSCASRAISVLSKLGNKSELLRSYFMASLQNWYAANIGEQEAKRKELMQSSMSYSEKALELSRDVDNPYYAAMANWAAAFCTLLFTQKAESALEYAKEMLNQGEIARDNYLKGVAFYVLTFATNWMILKEGDPDKRREGHEKIIKHAENAIHFLQPILQDYFVAGTYVYYAEAYSSLARDVLSSLEEKRAILEKAVNIGRQGLTHATRSGSPEATFGTLHALSKALHFYSELEREAEKKKLLEEALTHRKEYINIVDRVFPFNDWIRGVGKNYEGLIKAELARVETNRDKKISLLEDAISDIEKGLSHCKKEISARPVPTRIVAVARFEDWCGGILNELHLITNDEKILSRAIGVYGDAAEMFKKVNLPSRVAESYWKMARNQDRLGKHQRATEDFENALIEFRTAAEKIPNFAQFFLDYATYMKAWSEIERAKHSHAERYYGQAKEHYEKAADLHKSTKQWSHLSPNYAAWTRLEEAEDLSRREQTEEARDLFLQAANLFMEAKKSVKAKLETLDAGDEREMAAELAKASDTRREYCLGRIDLEEAKIFDRKGDHTASSEKYGSATERFQKAIDTMEREADQQELRPIVSLCQAWQTMTRAEAEASPTLYLEASQLFDEAKEHSLDEKAKVLALGHSRFCRALEAGVRFEGTRDTTAYTTTKKYIEAATNCYVKAGFKTASEYAKATYRLFDAYIYMNQAQIETDPGRKAQFHQMAEKLLQASAASFTKAKHPEKSEEVQRLLESVKEERQLAMSLVEVLHAPLIASTTTSFSTPNPVYETAVGLERFEHAHIQANLFIQLSEVKVGENVSLEIDLVNAGKEPASLVKVEDIVPAGFHIIEKPDMYRVEDNYLNLKGKRLDPLESEEVKIVVKPRSKGTFAVKPRVLYIDETGKYKSHEPDPVTIIVKELGIKGWIKGER